MNQTEKAISIIMGAIAFIENPEFCRTMEDVRAYDFHVQGMAVMAVELGVITQEFATKLEEMAQDAVKRMYHRITEKE